MENRSRAELTENNKNEQMFEDLINFICSKIESIKRKSLADCLTSERFAAMFDFFYLVSLI